MTAKNTSNSKLSSQLGLAAISGGAAGLGLSVLFNAAVGVGVIVSAPVLAFAAVCTAVSLGVTAFCLRDAFRIWSKKRQSSNTQIKKSAETGIVH